MASFGCVRDDFARQLERELTEARELAEGLRDLVHWTESEPWNFPWEKGGDDE